MKRIISTCFVCIFSVPFAFSQEMENNLNCGPYSKRIENNFTMSVANYNMKSKSDLEKLFFGDFIF